MDMPDEKKRTLEASKAKALEYKERLKRKSAAAAESPSSENEGNPPSSKKPRTQATPKGKSQGKSSRLDEDERAKKVAKRLKSRKYAEKYAKSLANGKGRGEGEGEGEGASDESDNGSDDMDTDTPDTLDAGEPTPMPTPAKPSPSPAAPKSRPTGSPAVRPSRSTQGLIPAVPPMPTIATPASNERRPAVGRSTHQPFANGNSGKNDNGGMQNPPTPSGGVAGRRSSFLRHANNTTNTLAATVDDAGPMPAVLNDSRWESETSETYAGPAQPGHHGSFGRSTFLSRARITPSAPDAAARGTVKATTRAQHLGVSVARRQQEPAAARRHGVEARAQGRARIWALNCAVALAPVMFFFLASGVLRAWPHVQVGAGQAWGTLRGFAARSPAAEKCFLLPSERNAHQAVCKKGAELADCPDQATCGGGSILACDFPLEKKMDGSACVLTAEAKEEVNAVVEALRTLTIEQLCKGHGLSLFSPTALSRRSFITLTDAAAAQNRGPLSFLAGMPPGNVAGLIDLEGDAAPDFGGAGGDDGSEENGNSSNKGSGSERVARLSEAAYHDVMSTPSWRCRARLAAGSWLMAYWPYCLGLYALVLIVGCLDVRRMWGYKKHVQVCTMRDEAYQALLTHASQDSSPMQLSHIQISVGDRRRTRGEGSQAAIQQSVSKLWPLVEQEVEHDTRIRRNYKNLNGQRNVPCWQWVGTTGTSFDSIGALDPGRTPRLWLLRWLN